MATASILDPFQDLPDPGGYVPREASDRALARLVACVRQPHRPCALLAPPGMGKTLLLHALARLVPELRAVYVPNPTLSPAELCAWTLDRLGAPAWDEPLALFKAYAAHLSPDDRALLWLMDDAHSLRPETATWLRRMLASHPGLRLVVAALDAPPPALGELECVDSLARPMSLEETRGYLRRHLERGAPTAGGQALAEAQLDAIHRTSGGVPRLVSEVVSALLHDPAGWTSARPLV